MVWLLGPSARRKFGSMSRTLISALTLVLAILLPAAANATIRAHIDISDQRLDLYVDGEKNRELGGFNGSGGKIGRRRAPFQPYWLHRHHRSSLFRGAPMPYSVFFQRPLRHPRHQSDQATGLTGLAWLHPAASKKRRCSVQFDPGPRQRRDRDRNHALSTAHALSRAGGSLWTIPAASSRSMSSWA